MPAKEHPSLVIRPAEIKDAPVCGQICYDAFKAINQAHGFPADIPEPAAAIDLLSALFSDPHFYSVVAEAEGRIVGSNCLDQRAIVAGVGPITIDTAVQNLGVGRRLMRAVMDRANERRAPGIRLVQAAFHTRSFSLYASLGFDVREPLSCVQGRLHDQTRERSLAGCHVRAAMPTDEPACNALSFRVHGFDRAVELAQSITRATARVVEREGCVTGYTSLLGFFGHTTAETNLDIQALIASAEFFAGPGILIPSRNSALLRWCLQNGLRVVQPMTLMSFGLYNDPAGAWLPSVLF